MTVPGPPDPPESRRAARAQREEAARRAPAPGRHPDAHATTQTPAAHAPTPARHARRRRRLRGFAILAVAGGLVLTGITAGVTSLLSDSGSPTDAAQAQLVALPPQVDALPVPKFEQTPVSPDICAVPEVRAALESGDDAAAIAAAGGGESFRMAVADGDAPCVDLADPARIWVVVNKQRPYAPVDYRPTALMMPDGVRSLEGGSLRSDAAAALTAMVTAAREAGAGEIALESGFRSYETQQGSYGRQVSGRGVEAADLVSARPGFSEHQSGLAGDVVGCAGACGSLDDLAGTAQGEWVAAHSWEHGWIVRYVEGATEVTGYLPEPWHLRYVGPDLARAYHDGGWTSLEEFFGLPAAPAYG